MLGMDIVIGLWEEAPAYQATVAVDQITILLKLTEAYIGAL